jgi:hypothetical protein
MKTNNNLTLVTGLFDIGRGSLSSGFSRSFSHYLESFAKLLKVNYPMVIYVPSDLVSWVWERRSKDNTHIVEYSVDKLRSFPFYDKVQEIRQKPEWINQAPWLVDSTQAKLELYNPLVMSKQFFLNDATHYNMFNTKYYLWVDAGLSNTIGDPNYYFDADFEKKIIPHLNKMMYVAFPYQNDAPEVHGFTKTKLNELAGTVTEYVCRGGLFGGNKESINDINDLYYQYLSSTLGAGYMGTEESIFTIIANKFPEKCKVNMIDGNGLIVKFLEEIKHQDINTNTAERLAWYFLVFNTPKQFEYTLDKFKKAYPDEFKEVKKYVINNSNDPNVDVEYKRIFQENNMEEFKFDNIGICGGRQFVAEHFDTTGHEYYVFFEEDMGVYTPLEFKDDDGNVIRQGRITEKCGLPTWHKDVFSKSIDIMEEHKLDYLKLSFDEFYGNNFRDWAVTNVPQDKRDIYFPEVDGKRNDRSKITYWDSYKALPYAVGHFHACNWPVMFTKAGSKKLYLDIKWAHQYEQTWMSHAKNLMWDGTLRVGSLLISIIDHNRIVHYDGATRRENANYKN